MERVTDGKGCGQMQSINTLSLVQRYWRAAIRPGAFCIDATAGRGHDTETLCRLVGPTGRVLAFDIQEEAVWDTRARLTKAGLSAQVICASHTMMADHAVPASVDAIVFNLGYLPRGDHRIATQPETTIRAIDVGLDLLKVGGIMTLCIYHGGDTGFAERDAVLAYLQALDPQRYSVLVTNFANRPNHPPIAVLIIKEIF